MQKFKIGDVVVRVEYKDDIYKCTSGKPVIVTDVDDDFIYFSQEDGGNGVWDSEYFEHFQNDATSNTKEQQAVMLLLSLGYTISKN